MKTIRYIISGLVIMASGLLLSGCIFGEKFCTEKPLVFQIPDQFTVVNTKDTFSTSDTLWLHIQVADTLLQSAGYCIAKDSTLAWVVTAEVYRGGGTPDTGLIDMIACYRKGTKTQAGDALLLGRNGSVYEGEYGLLLTDRRITAIGPVPDTTSTTEPIVSYPRDEYCRHTPPGEHCRALSRCYVQTTFSGGQSVYPIVIR